MTASAGVNENAIDRWLYLSVVAAAFVVPLKFDRIGLAQDGVDVVRWTFTAALLFGIPLLLAPRTRMTEFLRLPFGPLLAWAVVAVMSALWSITPQQSFLQGLSMLGLFVFAAVTVKELGWERWSNALLIGWTLFFAAGIITDTMDGTFLVERSQGVAFAPTNLATMSAIAILLSIQLLDRDRARLPPAVLAIGIAILALAGSFTRTPIAALALAIAVHLISTRVRRPRRVSLLVTVVATFLLVVQWSLGRDELARTDSAEDLSDFTGRTDIWSVIVDQIAERPFTGFGFASTRDLLREAAGQGDIGFLTGHAHNLLLQLQVETGVVGLFVFLAFIASAVVRSHRMLPVVLPALTLLIANGTVEALVSRAGEAPLVFAAIGAALAGTQARRTAAVAIPDLSVH